MDKHPTLSIAKLDYSSMQFTIINLLTSAEKDDKYKPEGIQLVCILGDGLHGRVSGLNIIVFYYQ